MLIVLKRKLFGILIFFFVGSIFIFFIVDKICNVQFNYGIILISYIIILILLGYIYKNILLNYVKLEIIDSSLMIRKLTKHEQELTSNIYPFEEISSYSILNANSIGKNMFQFKFKTISGKTFSFTFKSNEENAKFIEEILLKIHTAFTNYNLSNKSEVKIMLDKPFICGKYGLYTIIIVGVLYAIGLIIILIKGNPKNILSALPAIMIFLSVLSKRTIENHRHENLLKNNTF